MAFTRISKAAARKLFNEGKVLYLCPHKFKPGVPFNQAALITSAEYMKQAEMYRNNPKLWQGTMEATAWQLMYNNWLHYNASYEAGYYPAYYVES